MRNRAIARTEAHRARLARVRDRVNAREAKLHDAVQSYGEHPTPGRAARVLASARRLHRAYAELQVVVLDEYRPRLQLVR